MAAVQKAAVLKRGFVTDQGVDWGEPKDSPYETASARSPDAGVSSSVAPIATLRHA